jgi:hypothetical protein
VELNCPFPILPLGRVLRQDSELRRVVAQSTLVEFLSAETAQLSFTEMSKRREHYTKLCSILQQLARTPATVSLLSTLRFDNLCMQVSQWCLLVAGNTPPPLGAGNTVRSFYYARTTVRSEGSSTTVSRSDNIQST